MGVLLKAVDLLLVIGGFSLIIILHELGHFLAARWAGVRVQAFAVGFGSALVSFRKGLGWRAGSSEAEYKRLLAAERDGIQRSDPHRVSPTEYRLNVLPFGGYVKMLGQDDADPSARSSDPDSYTSKPVWKRMVIISAGVVANLLIAASLFIVVFMIGLKTEPPRVGDVRPGLPAATAVAINGAAYNITEPGLQPGDRILSVDGDVPANFSDVAISAIMARKDRPLMLTVEREGIDSALLFSVVPTEDPLTKTLQLGISPEMSAELDTEAAAAAPEVFRRVLDKAGLSGVTPDMRLLRVDGAPARSLSDVSRALRRSDGSPLRLEFGTADAGQAVEVVLPLEPELETVPLQRADKVTVPSEHLLSLLPVMQVEALADGSRATALKPGDVFARIGSVQWPSVVAGQSEIAAHKRQGAVAVTVARWEGGQEDGGWRQIELGEVPLMPTGTLGVYLRTGSNLSTHIAPWPAGAAPAAQPPVSTGSRITAVNDTPVETFGQLAVALRQATAQAKAAGSGTVIRLSVEPPSSTDAGGGGSPPTQEDWTLTADQVQRLQDLPWENPLPVALFKPVQFMLVAKNPVQAIGMGLDRTRSAMLSTYITFARLFQGTVKVEHLKGPVGIAHLGTMVAAKGFVWLMFFLALVSVNLAVINFLPIPIADGGHFVFLLYEQVSGRPPSVIVQNAAAIAGLVLIVGLFLVVTVNDIRNLFG